MAVSDRLHTVMGLYRGFSAFACSNPGAGYDHRPELSGLQQGGTSSTGALAGKKSRCKGCGEVFRIPVPTGE